MVSERAGNKKVSRVILEIGTLSGVMPDAIAFCFDIVAQGTVLEGAILEIIEPQARALCKACGTELQFDMLMGRCACGSHKLQIISGEELNVKSFDFLPEVTL